MPSLSRGIDIAGLPAHPLLVHAVVVLLPLAALAIIALVLVPRWRARFGMLTLSALVVATALSFFAKAAGQDLARRVGEPVEHAHWGARLPWVALTLLVVGGGWLLWVFGVALRRRPEGANDRRGGPVLVQRGPRAETTAAMAASVLAVVAAMAVLAVTVVVGHSGSTATWAARAGSGSADGPAGGAPSPAITSRNGTYTMEQVAEHRTAASCWSAINGDVYDLTTWIQHHPGGANAIRSICGADGSMGFNNRHAGTKEALATLPNYKIGTLLR